MPHQPVPHFPPTEPYGYTMALRVIDAVDIAQQASSRKFVSCDGRLAYREPTPGDHVLNGADVNVTAAIDVAKYFEARALKCAATGGGIREVRNPFKRDVVGVNEIANAISKANADLPRNSKERRLFGFDLICGIVAARFEIAPYYGNNPDYYLATDAFFLHRAHPCFGGYFEWSLAAQSEIFARRQSPAAFINNDGFECPVCGQNVKLPESERCGVLVRL